MDINEPCKLGAMSKLSALDQVRGNAPGVDCSRQQSQTSAVKFLVSSDFNSISHLFDQSIAYQDIS
jgi:hypothetical protein